MIAGSCQNYCSSHRPARSEWMCLQMGSCWEEEEGRLQKIRKRVEGWGERWEKEGGERGGGKENRMDMQRGVEFLPKIECPPG